MQNKGIEGKGGILLLVIALGILIVIGALAIFTGIFKQDALESPDKNVDLQDPNVVSVIEEPEAAHEDSEEEEEEAMVMRTINERGSHLYIGKEKVKIGRPGKRKDVYAYKIASPMNNRMKPYRTPDRMKRSNIMTDHDPQGHSWKGKMKGRKGMGHPSKGGDDGGPKGNPPGGDK